jgi:hypothetical protein
MKKLINIKIDIDTLPMEKYLKKKWKKFLLSCVIFRSNQYFVEHDFGYYSVGCFDGFEGERVKLKVGDGSYILCDIEDFHKSKQTTMKYIHRELKNGI